MDSFRLANVLELSTCVTGEEGAATLEPIAP